MYGATACPTTATSSPTLTMTPRSTPRLDWMSGASRPNSCASQFWIVVTKPSANSGSSGAPSNRGSRLRTKPSTRPGSDPDGNPASSTISRGASSETVSTVRPSAASRAVGTSGRSATRRLLGGGLDRCRDAVLPVEPVARDDIDGAAAGAGLGRDRQAALAVARPGLPQGRDVDAMAAGDGSQPRVAQRIDGVREPAARQQEQREAAQAGEQLRDLHRQAEDSDDGVVDAGDERRRRRAQTTDNGVEEQQQALVRAKG